MNAVLQLFSRRKALFDFPTTLLAGVLAAAPGFVRWIKSTYVAFREFRSIYFASLGLPIFTLFLCPKPIRENVAPEHIPAIIVSTGLITLLLCLITVLHINKPAESSEKRDKNYVFVLMFLVAAPAISIAITVLLSDVNHRFTLALLLPLVVLVECVLCVLIFRNRLRSLFNLISLFVVSFTLIISLFPIFFGWQPFIGFAQKVGPITGVVMFVTMITVFLYYCTRWVGSAFVPVLALGLFSACLSILDINDNDVARDLKTNKNAPLLSESFTVKNVFKAWLKDRETKQTPYTVYIIAAEGGGMYAAYHTAAYLAYLQEVCPKMASHIFAISAVSGGAVGSAIYAGLVSGRKKALNDKDGPVREPQEKASTDEHGCFPGDRSNKELSDKVEKIFDTDLLSPAIWSLLFPDFLQHFVPYPVNQLNRSNALEYALERTWEEVMPESRVSMSSNFYDAWADNKHELPLLLFNVTSTDGKRQLISPTQVALSDELNKEDKRLGNRTSMPLSTAAFLSARFPIISPPATIEIIEEGFEPVKYQTVDGGYYDNSALETAFEVVENILDIEGGVPDFVVKLLMLKSKGDGSKIKSQTDTPHRGELLAPVYTFYNSYNERGKAAVSRIEEIIKFINREIGDETALKGIDVLTKTLNTEDLSLSWSIKENTRRKIKNDFGDASGCYDDRPPTESNSSGLLEEALEDNNCVMKYITADFK